MATTTAVSSLTTGTTTTSSADSKKTGIIGKDEFMKMLIAQLKNQDPLNPMDGTNFAAQLAQFSTVEQVMNMANNLNAMSASISAMNNTQMTSMIGNEVTAKGNTVSVNGASSMLSYDLTGPTQKGTIRVYNSSGLLVKSIDVGSQSAGLNTVVWDSSSLPTGTYTFDVAATDKNGVVVPASGILSGKVTGVTYKDGAPYVTVNGQDIAFSSILSVKKPASS